jgi:anti-sigma B factor antagonist
MIAVKARRTNSYMPAAKATFREVGVVTIVDLSGLLRLGESSLVLRLAIQELIDKRRSKIVLNFQGVTEIDSAGIGELVAAYTTVKSKDGRLKLLSPPKKVCDMLKLTQLLKVLEVYADEESAIRSFN